MRNFCQVLHSCVRGHADRTADPRGRTDNGRTMEWSVGPMESLGFLSKENILPPSDPKSVYGPRRRHHDSRPTQKGQSATSTASTTTTATTYNWRGFGEMKCMKQGSKVITDGPRFMTGLVTFTPFERKGCPRGNSRFILLTEDVKLL